MLDHRQRLSGMGFFFVMLLVSAVLGGLTVLLGIKYTRLGAAVVPQGLADRQIDPSTQFVKAQQTPALVPAKALEQAIINVVKNVGPSVVMITTREEQTWFNIFDQPVTRERGGLGSGVIFDRNGYILTNNHVIAGQGTVKITVFLTDGRSVPGEVVGADPTTDLAVVKISGRDLPVARLGNSNRIQVGQYAVAIGNPLGETLRNTVTTGVISATDRALRVDETHVLRGMLQTDASINPGNSGGPLLNSDGEVIGINTAIAAQAQGIGFAIPIDIAKKVAQELILHGRVERPGLGIVYTPANEEYIARLENITGVGIPVDSGAFIREVAAGSGAAAAGLRPYDLLVQIGSIKIGPDFDVSTFIGDRRTGEKLEVVFYRLAEGAFGRAWRKHTAAVRISVVR